MTIRIWLSEKLKVSTSRDTRETDNTIELVYIGVYDLILY